MIKILKPDFCFTDERGTLTQLIRTGFRQINVIESIANTYRGGHYHKLNDEAFYIIEGRIELKLKKDDFEEKYELGTGDMFLIPASVNHDFFFVEDTKLVSMYSIGVENEDGTKDIYKVD
jgi:mannose-6-phosphate isomerase-like protein (cupin superfamily)